MGATPHGKNLNGLRTKSMAPNKPRSRRKEGKGPFKYRNTKDNHVIWPGSESDLAKFLGQSYKDMNHKKKNALSSNSEDALTWSCFNTLAKASPNRRALAHGEISLI
jgi:hypothetical protein